MKGNKHFSFFNQFDDEDFDGLCLGRTFQLGIGQSKHRLVLPLIRRGDTRALQAFMFKEIEANGNKAVFYISAS